MQLSNFKQDNCTLLAQFHWLAGTGSSPFLDESLRGTIVVVRSFFHCVQRLLKFSLKRPTIFLPAPFSYNYPSRSFLCLSNLNLLFCYLSYSKIMC